MKTKRFWKIFSICLSVLVLALGITLSCVDFSHEEQTEPPSYGATQPSNTSEYYISEGDRTFSGSGTEADPYLISSAWDLADLSTNILRSFGDHDGVYYYIGKYFKQTADIDLGNYWWFSIGSPTYLYLGSWKTSSNVFAGHYDGNGYKITNCFPKNQSNTYNSVFGRVHGKSLSQQASIKNLAVVDSYITGTDYVGGIVGSMQYATIQNCYFTGTVSASGSYVGGIVGFGSDTTITNCYNTGSISSSGSYVGGIIGRVGGSSIISYTTKITNTFNVGSVSGASSTGGTMGGWQAVNVAKFSKCYTGGSCSLSANLFGETKIDNLNTTSYAKNKDWFTNSSNWDTTYPWDFDKVWKISSTTNNGYPTLKESTKPVISSATYQLASYGYDVYAYAYDDTELASVTFPTWTASNGQDDLIWHVGVKGTYRVNGKTYNFKYSVKRSEHNNEVNGYITHIYAHDTSGNDSNCLVLLDNFSTVLWTDIDTYHPDGTQPNPNAPDGYGWAYFDLKIVDTAGRYSTTYSNLTNEPTGHIELGYGSTMTISNIRPMNPSLHKFSSITATNGITDNGNGTYTYTVTTADDAIKIYLTVASYDVTLNQAGGSGGTSSIKATEGLAMPTLSSLPTKEGYNFQGYYSGQNGTGTKYYNADGTSATTYNLTTGTTLYAYWTLKTWVDYVTVTNFGGGSGDSVNDPYIISEPQHLALLAKNVNNGTTYSGKFFKQTADLNMGAYPWMPIGNASSRYFLGTFDGDNHKISGLRVEDSTLAYIGLFGYLTDQLLSTAAYNPKVLNVKIIDSMFISTNSSAYVASVVGYTVGSHGGPTIENCYSNATLEGNNVVGGIVGIMSNYGGSLTNSTFDGKISGSAIYAGGIVGRKDSSYNPLVKGCINNGQVESTNTSAYVGGIAGISRDISNCISTGTLKSSGYLGSIVGHLSGGSLTNCAGYGMLNGSSRTGAIVGIVGNSCTITNCSFNGNSNIEINKFVGIIATGTVTTSSSYFYVNNKGYYTAGDFNDFTIAGDFNDGLPIQNALYVIGIWENRGSDVIKFFTDNNFELVS